MNRSFTAQINIAFDKLQIRSGGYGLLDVVFLPDGKNAWAVGGGGTIFNSVDGGATWQKDKAADDLPSNLYKIKFFGDAGCAPPPPSHTCAPSAPCLIWRLLANSLASPPRGLLALLA